MRGRLFAMKKRDFRRKNNPFAAAAPRHRSLRGGESPFCKGGLSAALLAGGL